MDKYFGIFPSKITVSSRRMINIKIVFMHQELKYTIIMANCIATVKLLVQHASHSEIAIAKIRTFFRVPQSVGCSNT